MVRSGDSRLTAGGTCSAIISPAKERLKAHRYMMAQSSGEIGSRCGKIEPGIVIMDLSCRSGTPVVVVSAAVV